MLNCVFSRSYEWCWNFLLHIFDIRRNSVFFDYSRLRSAHKIPVQRALTLLPISNSSEPHRTRPPPLRVSLCIETSTDWSGKPPQIPDDFAKTRHSSGNKPRNPDNITKIVTQSGKLTIIPDDTTKFTDSCGKPAPNRDNQSLVRYCIFAARKQ